jgi:hypothetical protein
VPVDIVALPSVALLGPVVALLASPSPVAPPQPTAIIPGSKRQERMDERIVRR